MGEHGRMSTNAAVEHETIQAVVEAYAEGKIKLPSVANEGYPQMLQSLC